MPGATGPTGAAGATGVTGPPGPIYFLGKANRGSSSAGGDSFYFPTAGNNLNQPTLANAAMRVGTACTLSDFLMTSDVTGYVSRTFTVLVGSTPNTSSMSASGLSISFDGTVTSGNSSATAIVSPGQFITIRDSASGANSVNVNFYWSLKCQ